MKIAKIVLTTVAVVALAVGADMAWKNRDALERIAATEGPAQAQAAAPQAMPVPVAQVVKKTLPIVLDYSARTEAIRSVSLQAKVGGFVAEQLFPDGADVAEGDLLYQLDPREYQAALEQAKGEVERDSAALDYAKMTSDRSSSLVHTGALAKDTSDQRVSARRQAAAALTMSQAAVRSAELSLGFTQIRAPFAGRLGRDQAPVGTLIGSNGAALNTLVQLNPIYVTFNPSEGDLAKLSEARKAGDVAVKVDVPGVKGSEHEGKLTFIDNAIDPQTGTITARATIQNDDLSLLPGQYVRISLQISEQSDLMMVPQIAVGSSQLGKYVYVIGKDGTVEQKAVTLGPTENDLVAANGVAESDQIITGNLQKIGVGSPVQPLPDAVASK